MSLGAILVISFLPMIACYVFSQTSTPAEQAAGPTEQALDPTEQTSNPATPSTQAQTVLYLCDRNDESHTKILTEEICQLGATQDIVYPQYGQTPINYEYTLPGDIQGTTYTFNLWLASGQTTTFDAQIVLRQGGKETVLASATFTATESDFKSFSQEVTGSDPAAAQGDILILRVIPASGIDGAVLYTNDEARTSYIALPSIKP